MQTVNVHVDPLYDSAGTEITGYQAGHDLAVTVRDLATAERRPTRRDAARPQAVAGAHGDVVLVREQVTPPSGPFPMTAGDMAASSEAVPIAPESSDVTVTVEMGWSLA